MVGSIGDGDLGAVRGLGVMAYRGLVYSLV